MYELLCYSYFRAPMAHDCIDVCEETLEMLFRQRGIPDMHLDVPSNFAISGVFALGAIADGAQGAEGSIDVTNLESKPTIQCCQSWRICQYMPTQVASF